MNAYQACGGVGCAPGASAAATAAKERFVRAFNPPALQHVGRTYSAGEL